MNAVVLPVPSKICWLWLIPVAATWGTAFSWKEEASSAPVPAEAALQPAGEEPSLTPLGRCQTRAGAWPAKKPSASSAIVFGWRIEEVLAAAFPFLSQSRVAVFFRLAESLVIPKLNLLGSHCCQFSALLLDSLFFFFFCFDVPTTNLNDDCCGSETEIVMTRVVGAKVQDC